MSRLPSRGIRTAVLLCLAAVAASCSANRLPDGTARATFAGGCFWCMEEPFEGLPGVVSVVAGFAGGTEANPTYKSVSRGASGYAESVEIIYEPSRISYERLLDVFWHNVDPLAADGQFCDRGRQYRSAIFFHDEEQRRLAEESKHRIGLRLGAPVATEIVPASKFHPAEPYHQDFYKKNPGQYQQYVAGCGRHRRLEQLWGSEAGAGGRKGQ